MDKRKLQLFKVKIFSQYQTYYEGDAVSLSASNRVGPFDILAGHTNFFSLLTPGTIALDTGSRKFTFQINHGLLHVNHDTVTLFADI